MVSRREKNNPFKPEQPRSSMDAAALVGAVLATIGFFAMGMLKEFSLFPTIFASLVVGVIAWYVLKGFLSRRR